MYQGAQSSLKHVREITRHIRNARSFGILRGNIMWWSTLKGIPVSALAETKVEKTYIYFIWCKWTFATIRVFFKYFLQYVTIAS